jgi:hypothetical protein
MKKSQWIAAALMTSIGLSAAPVAQAGGLDKLGKVIDKGAETAEKARKAQEVLKREVAAKKNQLRDAIKKGVQEADKIVAQLKDKASKLTGDKRAKADEVFALYAQAKGAANALVASIDGINTISAATDFATKVAAAADAIKSAINAYKAAVEAK